MERLSQANISGQVVWPNASKCFTFYAGESVAISVVNRILKGRAALITDFYIVPQPRTSVVLVHSGYARKDVYDTRTAVFRNVLGIEKVGRFLYPEESNRLLLRRIVDGNTYAVPDQ